ncbi:MAG: cobalt-precorrin-6A reductase [Azospirillum sp.]|nr:cobalt-precorrin-6A reductase [Azospirillum sp.]
MTRLLILGGTTEAASLARTVATRSGWQVITSLAGRTRHPAALPGALRTGGFGGAEGLADYLAGEQIDRVVDATHPFAARIARHAAKACARLGLPRIKLLRPAWSAGPGDRWIGVADTTAAAEALPERDARIFLTVGRQELAPFAARPALWFLVRLIEPPAAPLPLPDHELICARGPFDAASERSLLAGRAIDWLVCKNSGGKATSAKLVAARSLGLPVVMIARPPAPPGGVVPDVAAALAWLGRE